MTANEAFSRMYKARKKWKHLERNNPEEYTRRVTVMQPTIDRYNSEFGIGDDQVDDCQMEETPDTAADTALDIEHIPHSF